MRGEGLWESGIGLEAYGCGRRASDLIDIDLFVYCSREEAFAGRGGGEHGMDQFNSQMRLTLVKWLDDSLARYESPRTAWDGEREREESYTRFAGAGDRPGADSRPGLPEADFVVV